MAENELDIAVIKDDFYRDSFGKVIFIIIGICFSILMLLVVSIYIRWHKPKPITFPVFQDWRVQQDIPLDQPYLSSPDLLQWLSDVIPKSFVLNFYQYNDQLKQSTLSYTPDGWKVFLNQLNNYVNYNNVLKNKLFVTARPSGAPFILNEGLLSGRYGWWVQMPIEITTTNAVNVSKQTLTLQILIVRVSTLNNLFGVGIDNIIVAKGTGNKLA